MRFVGCGWPWRSSVQTTPNFLRRLAQLVGAREVSQVAATVPSRPGTGTGAGPAAVEVMPAVGHLQEPARLGASSGISRDGSAVRMRGVRENEIADTQLSETEQ